MLPLPPGAAARGARLREHHVAARRPAPCPLPWHVRAAALGRVQPAQRRGTSRQCSCRVTVTRAADRRASPPRTSASIVWCRSAPRSGRAARRRAPRCCSTSANRSPKVGADAPLTLTEKSNPSNPNVEPRPSAPAAPPASYAPPPIGIAQRLVGLRDLAELRRRRAVARIDVRMILPREPLVGALDVAERRAALEPEEDVEIHQSVDSELMTRFAIPRHCLPSSTTSASMTSPLRRRRPPPGAAPAAPSPPPGRRRARRRRRRLLLVERLGRLVLRRGQLARARARSPRRRSPRSPSSRASIADSIACSSAALSLSPVSLSIRSAP